MKLSFASILHFFLVALLFLAAVPREARSEVSPGGQRLIEGHLREMGTRKPLSGVNIYCFSPRDNPVPAKAVTDRDGHFEISVPAGLIRWRVQFSGYKVLEQDDDEGENDEHLTREFYLEKTSYLTYETTVVGTHEKRDDKTKSLSQDEFLTLAGSNGDPVKAVQNLPGVNRGNALSSQIIIEGSAPQDTRYSIDTQQVPLIFHFGGLNSVVTPEAVDHVDYLSAGFGPEYGETTAGLVNLYTKDPKTDRWHGFAYVDIFNTGGMVEGPLNDHSSLSIGLRKSYIGAVLGAVAKGNSNFNLTVAPDFDDLVIEYNNKLSATDSFKLVTVGSIDTLAFVLAEPVDQDPAIRGGFNQNTSFFRLIPEYTHQYDADTTGRLWLGLGQDSQTVSIGSIYSNTAGPVTSARAELEKNFSSSWKSYIGTDDVMKWSTISYQLPFSSSGQSGGTTPIGASSTVTENNTYFLADLALYWRNVLHQEDSRWTYMPGLRIDYFNQSNDTVPEPRFAARYKLEHGLTLRGATGLYAETPPPQDFDTSYGNPALKSQYAVHGTVGVEKDFKEGASDGWLVSSDLFYKYLYNLVESSSSLTSSGQPQYYNNNGFGKVYGIELLAKYQSHKWSGWLAYTLSQSTRTYPPAGEQLFQYDQTHNIILVADREFGVNCKFSGRIRYTTGNPYTPYTGASLDVDSDVYIPYSGLSYSSRLDPFYEVDARIDKKWIFDTWILTAYLDIENLTNHKNVQTVIYSYNYQQQTNLTGLPLLPTFGLKGEF